MTFRSTPDGKTKLICTVPNLPVTPGEYQLELVVGDQFREIGAQFERAGKLNVTFADVFGTGKLPQRHQERSRPAVHVETISDSE